MLIRVRTQVITAHGPGLVSQPHVAIGQHCAGKITVLLQDHYFALFQAIKLLIYNIAIGQKPTGPGGDGRCHIFRVAGLG